MIPLHYDSVHPAVWDALFPLVMLHYETLGTLGQQRHSRTSIVWVANDVTVAVSET